MTRAITEVSQTRAANIQGARDDLKKIRYKRNDEIYNRKWQFIPASLSVIGLNDNNRSVINFDQITTHVNGDMLDDISLILSSSKHAGLNRAIIVNLTNPNVGIPMVRAIVPGLETFELTNSIMGTRARQYYRELGNS